MRSYLSCVLLLAAVAAPAAPFTPGNVVVYRVGPGIAPAAVTLTATGNAVFLDEYNAAGTKVQSIALPTAAIGAQRALVASGTATTDGLLTRSADGACLVVPGYGRDLGTGSGNLATSAGVTRIVGRVTPAGTVDTSTALTDTAIQSNFRGAASADCNGFWVSGTAGTGLTGGGVRYATLGSTTSNDLTSASFANTRAVVVNEGQLFVSASVTALRAVASVGSGLPTLSAPTPGLQAVAKLTGLPDPGASGQPYAFWFAGPDVLYVADESFGIAKYSRVAGTWVANGTVGVGADTYRGIAGSVNGTVVTLFATRKGGSTATGGGELVTLVDSSGHNGALVGVPSLIATAAVNTAFRGVAMAPVAPPPPSFIVTPSAGANGSIDPAVPQSVFQGGNAQFTVTPAFGYQASVGGTCGGGLNGAVYTTAPVFANCTVVASFTPLPHYTVSPSVGAHGTIDPPAPVEVISGQSASFQVLPAPGYNAAVRGTCGGSFTGGNTYVTKPVTGNCTISVVFAKKLVLFVGNSYTFGRVDPVMSYNTANVTDLTLAMWLANASGSNEDEPHPWGGIPGVFKKLTDQAGLEYDVSISARNAASLRGHYLNTNPAGWDLRGNITSQRWNAVVLQELSDGALPAGRGANANLANFNTYVDLIEQAVHANSNAQVFLYETWARPDMIGPNGTNADGLFYSAAEGIEAMTADLHNAYFGRFAANGHIEDVSPVGDAFLRAVTDGVAMRDPYVPEAGKINLWHTDYFHPSKYGSYLSAAVHFATITGINPLVLGSAEQAAADLGIAPDVAMKLQRVAQSVVSPDLAPPVTVATVSEAPNALGWNRGDVTVSLSASDDIALDSIRYTLAGAQAGAGTFGASGAVTISAEGVTTMTYYAVDRAGNVEAARTIRVAIDRTPPAIAGMPEATCNLWPPNNKMVDVATVRALDDGAGLASFSVAVSSNEAQAGRDPDIAISGDGLAPRTVSVRASREGSGTGRVYTVTAIATDAAGNSAAASAACTVPLNQR